MPSFVTPGICGLHVMLGICVVLSLFDGIGAGYCALNNCLARWVPSQYDGFHLRYIAVENDEKCQQVMYHQLSREQLVKQQTGDPPSRAVAEGAGGAGAAGTVDDDTPSITIPNWMMNGHRRNHELLNGQGSIGRDMWGDIKVVEKAVAEGKHRELLRDTFIVFNGFPCNDVSGNRRCGRQTSNAPGAAGEHTGLLREAERIIDKLADWKVGSADVSAEGDANGTGVPTSVDVSTGTEPGPEEMEKPFVGWVLKHNFRRYLCKDNDSVESVCQKLNVTDIRTVYEVNRRRLYGPDPRTCRQGSKLKRGVFLLIHDKGTVLETEIVDYIGWVQLASGAWIEKWEGRDQYGQTHDLAPEDLYTGLQQEGCTWTVNHDVVGKEIIYKGDQRAKIVSHLPPIDQEPALWKIRYVDRSGDDVNVWADLDEDDLKQVMARTYGTHD